MDKLFAVWSASNQRTADPLHNKHTQNDAKEMAR